MKNVSFSVIVCTRERCEILQEALESLDRMDYPTELCEILVVDNASRDRTRKAVEEYARSSRYQTRYLFEPQVGLSQARNCGWKAALNQVVAYIDDDELVEPDWLSELAYAFEDEKVICAGGRIELLWEGQRPDWLPEELEGYLGSTRHLGEGKRLLPPRQTPFGGNIAVYKDAIKRVGGFDPNFGRAGMKLGSNEEIVLVEQIRKLGSIYFIPAATVHHRVPPSRLTKQYFYQRGYHQGLASKLREQYFEPRRIQRLWRSFAIETIYLIGDILAVWSLKARGLEKKSFARSVFAATRFGMLVGIQKYIWKPVFPGVKI